MHARSSWSGFLLAALLVPLLAGRPVHAQLGGQDLEGKPIVAIQFRGLERLTPEAVKELMQSKEGEAFRRDVLDRDVKLLSGYRETVSTEDGAPRPGLESARPGPGRTDEEDRPVPKVFRLIPSVKATLDESGKGVVIEILAQENQRVAGLVFLGAVEMDREELLPLMRTRSGNLVDDFTLELDRQEILRAYRNKGFHYCTVEFVKQAERLGDLIVFKIIEGSEVTIRSVTFEGENAFTKNEMLKEMPFTEEPGLLSSKEFVLDQIRRDAVALTNFYRGRGYRDAQATLLDWRPTPSHDEVDLVFSVNQGPLYTVKSIKIEGLTVLPPEELFVEMKTVPGSPYQPGFDLQKDIELIEEKLQGFGYTQVRVADESTFGLEGTEVDVVLTVQEGQVTYVGEIIVNGNVETQDRVIRRDIELYTGEPLDLKKLKESRQRIRALRYWVPEKGVGVGTPEIPVSEHGIYRDAYLSLRDTKRSDIKDVVIDLEEQDTGSIRFAAGLASTSGFIGDITYEKQNFDPTDFPDSFDDFFDAFTGGGQFLTLSFQPGTRVTRYRASWGNPRIFDSPWLVVGDLYRTVWFREDWDEERLGASIRVGRRLGSDVRGDLTLRNELVEVSDIDGDAPQIVFDFEGERNLASLTLDLRLSRVDDIIDPTDGFTIRASLEHAGLWGDIEYNKALLSGETYFDILEDDAERHHVLQLRGTLGWGEEYGDSPDIPIYERFFAGGENSLRGFRFRGVGPQENDSPTGGKALWLAGAEYQFPLVAEYIRGVAFVDSGSVAETWGDDSIFDARVGVGVGLRVVIPFLGERPVALDFGLPVVDYEGDEKQIISFSFGRYF